jgi:hypothetical protein
VFAQAKRIAKMLGEAPRYTMMRGVARFEVVRYGVPRARGLWQKKPWQDYIKDCAARRAQSSFPSIDPPAFVEELRKNGVAFGLQLPPDDVRQIMDYAQTHPCYADRDPHHGFLFAQRSAAEAALKKPILIAQYFNAADCPAIARLTRDPILQEIAALYLGSVPTFVGSNVWWTFAADASQEDRSKHAHVYHRDVDDFRFFKFFFYITDVEADDSAHICVVASHRDPPIIKRGDQWNIRRYSDAEIEGYYPKERILEITGKGGTGFAENTLCIHKGSTPKKAPRLLLQLQYALFNYGVTDDVRDPATLKNVV